MDAVAEAQKRYADALKACSEQRMQIEEDAKFSDPSHPQQWDEKLKRARETDPGGARPCLIFDQVTQYVQNVSGQVTLNPPSLHALPAGGGADIKVAEQYDGFFRHIEHTSRAVNHYGRAALSAARVGVGYLTLRPEYVDRALNYQEPRIGSEGDALRVVFDPWSVEIDGSDATMGYILTSLSLVEFERQFGAKAEKVSFGDMARTSVRDERESITIAEQWLVETRKRNCIVAMTPDGDEQSFTEDDFHLAQQRGQQLMVRGTYMTDEKVVHWCKMSGAAVLEEPKDPDGKVCPYPADGIGIVPVYGYVSWVGGRMKYCGMARRAMEPQRAYNFHMSEQRAYAQTAPKAPWLAPVRAIRGLEQLWDRASVDQRAYLPYHDVDDTGPIAPPTRAPIGINLQTHIEGANQALHDIQASLGMYQANLGAPSNEQSGVAIDARKQQGEASTSNFPSNLSASIGQLGKLTMQMIPRLIDTRRQLRILGHDNKPGSVTADPRIQGAYEETDQGLVINPNVGRYDVFAVVGSSFATQRTQAQAAFTEMMRANPNLTPAIAPLWALTLDVPDAPKLAQVLTAVAPPEVRAVLNPESDKQPKTADLIAHIQQLKAGLQEAIQHAHDAQAEADQMREQAQSKQAEDEARARELDIKAYDSETKRLQVTGANEAQIQAIVNDLINQMLTSPAPLGDEAQEPQPGPDAWQPQPMPAGEGPGLDGTPQHEQAEAPAYEQFETQAQPGEGEMQ